MEPYCLLLPLRCHGIQRTCKLQTLWIVPYIFRPRDPYRITKFVLHFLTLIVFLFLPQILQTGKEITELDHSGYSTQGPTVFAGNLGSNRYAIQVTNMGVRLLEGGKFYSSIH